MIDGERRRPKLFLDIFATWTYIALSGQVLAPPQDLALPFASANHKQCSVDWWQPSSEREVVGLCLCKSLWPASWSVASRVGLGWLLPDFDNCWHHEAYQKCLLHLACTLEAEPSLLGVSAHPMAVAERLP